MYSPSTYLPISKVVELTGVPSRTIEEWIRAGMVSTLVGKRAQLVRLGDVRACLSLTGQLGSVAEASQNGSTPQQEEPGDPAKQPATEIDQELVAAIERALKPEENGHTEPLYALGLELDRVYGERLKVRAEQMAELSKQLADREGQVADLAKRLAVLEEQRVTFSDRLWMVLVAAATGIAFLCRRFAWLIARLATATAAGVKSLLRGIFAGGRYLGTGILAGGAFLMPRMASGGRAVARGATNKRPRTSSWAWNPRLALITGLLVVTIGGLFNFSHLPFRSSASEGAAVKPAATSLVTPTAAGTRGASAAGSANTNPTPEPTAPPTPGQQAAATPRGTPTGAWQPTHQVANQGARINFRAGPSTTFAIREQLSAGTELRFLQEQQDTSDATWMHFQLADGTDGWIRSIDVVPITPS